MTGIKRWSTIESNEIPIIEKISSTEDEERPLKKHNSAKSRNQAASQHLA